MSLLIYFVYWLLISLLIESGRCFSFPDFFFFTIFHIFKTLNNYFAFEYVSWLCSMIYAIVIWRVKESVDKRSYFFRNFLELHWSDVVSLIRRCCQLICLFFGVFFFFWLFNEKLHRSVQKFGDETPSVVPTDVLTVVWFYNCTPIK